MGYLPVFHQALSANLLKSNEVVEQFNRTIKLYLNKLMVWYNTQNWLLSYLKLYPIFSTKRSTGMHPAQVDNDEEQKIALQKAAGTVYIQYYYDNKYLKRAHHKRVFREIKEGKQAKESNNAFKKERPN